MMITGAGGTVVVQLPFKQFLGGFNSHPAHFFEPNLKIITNISLRGSKWILVKKQEVK